jgi:predicted nucleotidyltransferase
MLAPAEWTNDLISADVRAAARLLAAEPGVTRVWFFGSAARREPLDYASDLDFAVQGLPAARLIAVLGELLCALHAPVDLVRWEEASDQLRAQILATGTVIHAA